MGRQGKEKMLIYVTVPKIEDNFSVLAESLQYYIK